MTATERTEQIDRITIRWDTSKAEKELCETYQIGLMSTEPHPTPNRAANGETLADWARWMKMMKNYATLAKAIRAFEARR